MKHSIIKPLTIIILIILTIFIVTIPAMAANTKRFKLEIFGGLAFLNPKDFNTLPQYDRAYTQFFSTTQYNYFHNQFGQFYTFTQDKQGELKEIKQAPVLGARLKYRLNKNLWLSLGFQTMKKEELSGFNNTYIVHSIDPDAVVFDITSTITRRNDPYSLEIKAYSPMLGIHFQVGDDRFINLEAYLSGGPLFGTATYFREQLYHESDQWGYWYQNSISNYMDGKGTGIAAEVGLQINIRVFKGFRFFIEGNYAYRRISKISGESSIQTTYEDAFAESYTTSNSWQGDWVMVTSQIDREWGGLYMPFPSNQYDIYNPTYFKLDLSGLQLKAGLAIKF